MLPTNVLGLTPRALAEANGHKEIVEMIDASPDETLDEKK